MGGVKNTRECSTHVSHTPGAAVQLPDCTAATAPPDSALSNEPHLSLAWLQLSARRRHTPGPCCRHTAEVVTDVSAATLVGVEALPIGLF